MRVNLGVGVIPVAVGVGAALFTAGAAAGPLIAVGAVPGVALAVAIYAMPIIGLTLMVLAGTALQILGSEHAGGLPVSLGKIAGALTLATWAARSVLHRRPAPWSPQMLALMAFLAAIFLAVIAAPGKEDAEWSLNTLPAIGMLATLAGATLFVLAAVRTLRRSSAL